MYFKVNHLICLLLKVLSVYYEHSECLDTEKKIPGNLIRYHEFYYLILATCFLRHRAFHEKEPLPDPFRNKGKDERVCSDFLFVLEGIIL